MRKTEKAIANFANEALEKSSIDVRITQCGYPFLMLTTEVKNFYDTLDQEPTDIISVDLKLRYDKASSLYKILIAELFFDNSNSLVFAYEPSDYMSKYYPDQYLCLHKDQPTNEGHADDTPELHPASLVAEILEGIGLSLPKEKQEATWKDISSMLQFAKKWTAKTERDLTVNDTNKIHITDFYEGSEDNIVTILSSPNDDGLSFRAISFCVDSSYNPTTLPHTTMVINTSSNSRSETPCIKGIWNKQIEFVVPRHDQGQEILGALPTRRTEVEATRQLLDLDQRYLVAARETIALVRGEI
ncbi:hypothetical protein H7171_02515 [Candidatus Saccharibacteria bacterium]|nr:hypothetical protein [Candidatus Saccharibacteria bacterium]